MCRLRLQQATKQSEAVQNVGDDGQVAQVVASG
jgi:hypothetical protein